MKVKELGFLEMMSIGRLLQVEFVGNDEGNLKSPG